MAKSKQSRRKSRKISVSKTAKKTGPGYTQYNSKYTRRAGTAEKKYRDWAVSHVDANDEGRIYGGFLEIAVGDTANTRIGNKVTVTNVNFRGVLEGFGQNASDAGIAAGDRVRTIWFWDTQANGTVPNVDDVLQEKNIDSFRNMEQAPRFVILKDKTYTFNAANARVSGAAVGAQVLEVSRDIKFSWKGESVIRYGTGTGSTAGIRANNLCLLVICETLESHSRMSGRLRVKYMDM